MDGSPNSQKPHICFFPFPAHGHTIPMLDTAKLLAKQGARASIITTSPEDHQEPKKLGPDIQFLRVRFPSEEVGLPEGVSHSDNLDSSPEAIGKFNQGLALLCHPLEALMEEHKPNCLVADMFFPWAIDVASKFGVPTVIFVGTSFFSSSAAECVRLYRPHESVSSDEEPFVIPNFPGDIQMTRGRLPIFVTQESEFSKFREDVKKAELRARGVVVNSFYELEPEYAVHFRGFLGRKVWHVGPVSLSNDNVQEKAKRGRVPSIDEHACLEWLDSKEPNSVVYVSFGTTASFTSPALVEIAVGLENSGLDFIWVVRRSKTNGSEEDWLPEGFEERTKGRGLIIRGWAPQVLILEHEAVGGFVTHCGWNSTVEAICAGVPMVTWPVAAEQFYNEKLVAEVLRIGAPVGAKKWARLVGDEDVKSEALEKALARVMVGEEAGEMRRRASKLAELGWKAVQEGGSSYRDLGAFIEEFRTRDV